MRHVITVLPNASACVAAEARPAFRPAAAPAGQFRPYHVNRRIPAKFGTRLPLCSGPCSIRSGGGRR